MRRRALVLTFVISILSLVGIMAVAKERQDTITIMRNLDTEINREISDAVCISYEIIEQQYKCNESSIRDNIVEAGKADFLILSEESFNQEYSQYFNLLIPLYRESFTVVVKEDELEDFHLTGKGNLIGIPDNDRQFQIVKNFIQAIQLPSDSYVLKRYKTDELVDRFCHFDINVVFLTSIQPNNIVRKLNTVCDGKIISILDELPANFFQRNRYYYQMTIPKETYWRINEDINTFSTRYFLAVNKRFDRDLLSTIFDNFVYELKEKKTAYPAFVKTIEEFENSQTPLDPLGNFYIYGGDEERVIVPLPPKKL